MAININCDMGESFGIYKMGDDEAVMPYITEANVACGFHGSDPNHMRKTVELAKRYNIKVGAHFSLPDLQGFGRRVMAIGRAELANAITYQVGALKAFLDLEDMKLNHLKPHGALYGMAARDEEIAHAICDAGKPLGVPVFGLAGTLHEEIYHTRGLEFRSEFFPDLEYDDEGRLLITREHDLIADEIVAERALTAVKDGVLYSVNGKPIPVRAETICIHSDTPNVLDIVKSVRTALSAYL